MSSKLTKTLIDRLEPRDKQFIEWDSDLSGFGVRVMPSGVKSYVIQYRSKGRSHRINVARHGTLTLDQARKKARGLLGNVAEGANPAEELHTHRRSPTVAQACERFMAEHVEQRCKSSTKSEYRRSIDLFINPAIGTFKLVDVTRADIAKLHHGMRDKPYQANRTLGVLSVLFNLAEVWGIRPDGSNPCRHVKKYREEKRERYLSTDELGRLGQALDAFEAERPEMRPAVNCVRLLILTGCRLGEIQTLKWSFVNGDGIWLPDSKTGAKKVYLSPAAKAVLESIEHDPKNEYVITGKLPGRHLTDMQRPWRRIRARAGLDDVRLHDLRHSFASAAVGLGESLPMIGKLLGHSQVQTTARYAHLADNPVQQSVERISETLDQALRRNHLTQKK